MTATHELVVRNEWYRPGGQGITAAAPARKTACAPAFTDVVFGEAHGLEERDAQPRLAGHQGPTMSGYAVACLADER